CLSSMEQPPTALWAPSAWSDGFRLLAPRCQDSSVPLREEQVDEVLAEEDQREGAADERQSDDRDRRAGHHFGDLTLAGAADEDQTEDREEDRGDPAEQELHHALGVDALGLGGLCEGVRDQVRRIGQVNCCNG